MRISWANRSIFNHFHHTTPVAPPQDASKLRTRFGLSIMAAKKLKSKVVSGIFFSNKSSMDLCQIWSCVCLFWKLAAPCISNLGPPNGNTLADYRHSSQAISIHHSSNYIQLKIKAPKVLLIWWCFVLPLRKLYFGTILSHIMTKHASIPSLN